MRAAVAVKLAPWLRFYVSVCALGSVAWTAPAHADEANADEDAGAAADVPGRAEAPPADEATVEAESPAQAEVLVQGRRSPTGVRPDPTPAAFVLSGEALDRPGQSAADALGASVGVQVTRRGGSADLATLSLRGSTNAQAPIYLGGMQLNDELTGTVDLSTLPLWMMHRVEIYRGHAPTSVDELGMGGAVLLEPRLPERGRPFRANANIGFGAFGQRSGHAAISIGGPQAGASFSVSHHAAQDDYTFVDDGGTRFDESDDVVRKRVNADHADTDVWALGRVSRGPATVSMVVSGFDRRAGAPGLQLDGAEFARAARRRWLGGLSLVVGEPGSTWTLQTDVGALLTRYRLDDPRSELGFSQTLENRGWRNNARIRLTWLPHPRLGLTLGGSQTASRLQLDADARSLVRASRRRLRPAFSALAEPVDGLHLSGVAAVTSHDTNAQGALDPDALLIPTGRVGARFDVLDELAVFANVGRYARVPTLGELYGVAAGVLGNAELDPEIGISADAGVSLELRKGPITTYGQLAGFLRFADALIAYRRSSLGVIRPYNIGAARVLGAELAAGVGLYDTLAISAALTTLDPRDVSDERTTDADLVPLLARLVFTPRVALSAPRWNTIALHRASIGASLAYRSSRVADPAGLIVLDEQARLDIDAALGFDDRVVFRARMQNALDTPVFDVVGYPLPGRAFYADLEVTL